MLSLCLALAGAGCVAPGSHDGGSDSAQPDLSGGKADWGAVELSVDGLELEIDPELRREAGRRGDVFVLTGRTNRNVEGGEAALRSRANAEAVAFGTYTQVSGQRFELSWPVEESGRLLAGAQLFITLDMQREDLGEYALMMRLSPTVASLLGVGVNPSTRLTPFLVDGRVQSRLEGRTDDRYYGLAFWIGEEFLHSEAREGAHDFHFDVREQTLLGVLGTGAISEITRGHTKIGLALAVSDIEVRHNDRGPENWHVWDGCWNGVRTCINELPEGSLDLSSCGPAQDLLPCTKEMGTALNRGQIDAALDRAPLTREDAVALVGEARADQLVEAVRAELDEALGAREGAWYRDETAVAASLDAEAARVVGRAYALPLERVDAIPMTTNEGSTAGDIAADALLRYLPTYDFVHSEFEGTLVDIVSSQYGRPEHVQIFGLVRRGVSNLEDDFYIEVDEGASGTSFGFHWLGAYIEISVSADSEPRVYLEID